jgi:hypothetical protein
LRPLLPQQIRSTAFWTFDQEEDLAFTSFVRFDNTVRGRYAVSQLSGNLRALGLKYQTGPSWFSLLCSS